MCSGFFFFSAFPPFYVENASFFFPSVSAISLPLFGAGTSLVRPGNDTARSFSSLFFPLLAKPLRFPAAGAQSPSIWHRNFSPRRAFPFSLRVRSPLNGESRSQHGRLDFPCRHAFFFLRYSLGSPPCSRSRFCPSPPLRLLNSVDSTEISIQCVAPFPPYSAISFLAQGAFFLSLTGYPCGQMLQLELVVPPPLPMDDVPSPPGPVRVLLLGRQASPLPSPL